MNRLTGNLCDCSVGKPSANNCHRKKQQRGLEFFHQDERVAPACFPLLKSSGGSHHSQFPPIGRRTAMRRTLSPRRAVTLSTNTLMSSAGRFSSRLTASASRV